MVDKELLEAIGQMMEAQEKRLSDMMDTKLAQKIWMQCKNSLTYTMPCSKSTPVKYLT